MDELELFFNEISEQEAQELLAGVDSFADEELTLRIKERLGIAEEKKKSIKIGYILSVAAAFAFLVVGIGIFALNHQKAPEVTTVTTASTTEAPAPVENPLMVAISTGDDDLITKLLSLPGLITTEALEFALNFSASLSYETLHDLAASVKAQLGSTGLDSLLEGTIFGDSSAVLQELKTRGEVEKSPLERLAFFFAVAFCDSEAVDEFVKLGYDVNMKDLQGNSIYAIAEKYGNQDVMQYAISKGIAS